MLPHCRRFCFSNETAYDRAYIDGRKLTAGFCWTIQAGRLIVAASGKVENVETKGVRSDLVTEVDKACEDLIKRRIQVRHFPGRPIFFLLGLNVWGKSPNGFQTQSVVF